MILMMVMWKWSLYQLILKYDELNHLPLPVSTKEKVATKLRVEPFNLVLIYKPQKTHSTPCFQMTHSL